MPVYLAVTLVAFAALHLVLAGSLVRRAWWKAVLAVGIVPLAPYWGWAAGMRRRVYAWCAALFAYALGVAIAGPGL